MSAISVTRRGTLPEVVAKEDLKKTQKQFLIDSEDSGDEYYLHSVGGGSTDPILVEISLNGTDVQMEVDTGASVSLISEETLSLIKNENTCITKVKDKLLTYTGEQIAVLGTVNVEVQHRGNRTPCPFMSHRERTNLC